VRELEHKIIRVQARRNNGSKAGNYAIEQFTPVLTEINYEYGVILDAMEDELPRLILEIKNRQYIGRLRLYA
jgi:hypothetical protein